MRKTSLNPIWDSLSKSFREELILLFITEVKLSSDGFKWPVYLDTGIPEGVVLGMTEQSPSSPLLINNRGVGNTECWMAQKWFSLHFGVNLCDPIWTWVCNVVVNVKPSSEVIASRNESPSLPGAIPAYTRLEAALALVDSNISLKASLEQESWNLIYKDFLTKCKNNLNGVWWLHHKTLNKVGVSD